MARKRFNRAIIASSDNYRASKKAHKAYLKEQHINNTEVITILTQEVVIKKQAFIQVFGKLIPISEQEITQHKSLNIIYQ